MTHSPVVRSLAESIRPSLIVFRPFRVFEDTIHHRKQQFPFLVGKTLEQRFIVNIQHIDHITNERTGLICRKHEILTSILWVFLSCNKTCCFHILENASSRCPMNMDLRSQFILCLPAFFRNAYKYGTCP